MTLVRVAELGSSSLKHDGQIRAVAVTPDGKRIVSAGDGAHVWDATTGELVSELLPRVHRLNALAIAPDGRRVVVGGHVVRVIELATRIGLGAPMLRKSHVTAVAFAPDNSIVFGDDTTPRRLDVRATELPPLAAHRGAIEAIAVSRDGRRALTCGADGTIKLHALGDRPEVLATWQDRATSCGFSPDGTLGWTAGYDHATIHGLTSGKVTFEDRRAKLRTAALAADGSRFAVATDDDVHVYALPGKRALAQLQFSAESLAFTPDGARLVAANTGHGRGESGINVFDLAGERRVLPADAGHTGAIAALAVPAQLPGVAFSLGGDDGAIVMWDLDARAGAASTIERIGNLHGTGRALAATADGRTLVTTASEEALVAWDVRRTERSGFPAEGDAGTDVVVSPDDRYIAYQSYRPPLLQVFARATRARVLVAPSTRWHRPGGVAFVAPEVVAAATRDGVIALRIPTGERVWAITEYDFISALCVAGETILIGDPDGSLALWDAATGEPRDTLRRSGHEVFRACAVDADHVVVLLRADDYDTSMLETWKLSTRSLVDRTTLGVGARALAVSPDGRRVYAGTNTSRVLVFDRR